MSETPTHRCPACGGTGQKETKEILRWERKTAPCATCTEYGPFGLVPYHTAIECALVENVAPLEKRFRNADVHREAVLSWLLQDGERICPKCEGTGYWPPPSMHGKGITQRPCRGCEGTGR